MLVVLAAMVPALPASTRGSHVLAAGEHATSGLCFSGGSLPGALNSQVLFRALEEFVSDEVTVSTVSGGSIGYMLAVNYGDRVIIPPLGDDKWDMRRLENWEGAGDLEPDKLLWNTASKALNIGALKTCLKDMVVEPFKRLKKMFRWLVSDVFPESSAEVRALADDSSSFGLLEAARAAAKRDPRAWMDVVNKTRAGLLTAQGPAHGRGSVAAQALWKRKVKEPPASCADFPAAPTLLDCLEKDMLFDATPVWQCIIRYLAKSMELDIEQAQPGPRPWHVTYSATAGKPMKPPFDVPADETLPALVEQIAVISFSALDKTHHSNPSLPITGERSLLFGRFNPASTKSIDLAYAVGFSSMFINMGTLLTDHTSGKSCESPLGLPTWAVNYANYITMDQKADTFVKERGTDMLATDGGETDVLGIIPLLRQAKTSIVSAFIAPSDPRTYALSRLFGVVTRKKACSAYDALGESMQVFKDSSLWAPLAEAMTSKENSGVHVLRDVEVQANPDLGVPSYTLKTLIIIDNWSKTGFEESVLDGEETLAALQAQGFPCTGEKTGEGLPDPIDCSLNVSQPVSVAMALLNQWKVQQNAQVLKDALSA